MQITNLGIPVRIFTDQKNHVEIRQLTEEGRVPTRNYKALVFHRPASPLFRRVLQDIELGEGWPTYAHSQFGKFNFKPV